MIPPAGPFDAQCALHELIEPAEEQLVKVPVCPNDEILTAMLSMLSSPARRMPPRNTCGDTQDLVRIPIATSSVEYD